LSDTATVALLLSARSEGGVHPEDLTGLDAVVRSGAPRDLPHLLSEAERASRAPVAASEPRSDDPAARLQQLIADQMTSIAKAKPLPLAIIVSGNVEPKSAFGSLERQFGRTTPVELISALPSKGRNGPTIIRERIAKPLAQGALGYAVEGPPPGTRDALAWQILLYVLTHDYSGRLGRSAIADKGIVYHIYSSFRTDGRRSWATISTGVDPDKADAMEAELRAQLARLVSEPSTAAEVEAARTHLLGRNLTAAQDNEEIVAKLGREFVETGGLRSHEQLRAQLQAITPADLAAAARSFVNGTILRVDVPTP
jgi:predicted Zn-dependent peptidase